MDSHKAKVAWDTVCRPKEQGGLGLKRVTEWNRAAMLKHIWHIFSDPEDSVWARWVRTYLLREHSFWQAKQPDRCSWIWRRLLTLRYLVRRLISWRMGDGSRISFWFDSWSPLGPLVEVFGREEIERSRIPATVSVAEFFADPSWQSYIGGGDIWIHRHRRACFDRLHGLLPVTCYPSPGITDRVIWSLRPDGDFTIASAWKHIRSNHEVVPWASFVWSKGMLPRFSFILWLAVQGRLYTSDMLFSLGVSSSSTCALCGSRRERLDHLFFTCNYSTEVWSYTLGRVVAANFPRRWSAITELLFSPAGATLRRRLPFARMLGGCVYYLWMERNKRRIGERLLPPRILASFVLASMPRT